MKTTLLLACTAVLAMAVPAFGASAPRLNGLANFGGKNRALLEFAQPGKGPSRVLQSLLSEGERLDDVEIVKIDERACRVTLRLGKDDGVVTNLSLPLPEGGEVAGRTVYLKDASLDSTLELLQQLSGLTILRSPVLIHGRHNLVTGATTVGHAVQALTRAMATNGVITQMRGDKFLIAVPLSETKRLPRIAEPPAAGDGEKHPPGSMVFRNAALLQVLEIYQEVSARTVIRNLAQAASPTTLRSQTALTSVEFQWVLDTVLFLANVSMVPRGGNLVFAVESGLSPMVPAFDPAAATAKAAKGAQTPDLKFNEVSPAKLLETYAALVGREAAPKTPQVPGIRLSLRPQKPLSPAEAVYALEGLAFVHGLAFEIAGDKVKLVPAAQARREAGLDAR
jgi:hypothetical protein